MDRILLLPLNRREVWCEFDKAGSHLHTTARCRATAGWLRPVVNHCRNTGELGKPVNKVAAAEQMSGYKLMAKT